MPHTASSSAGLTFATRAQVQPEKKQLSKKELLSLQEKYPLARNAVRNWNCLNTTIRRLVHGQQVNIIIFTKLHNIITVGF